MENKYRDIERQKYKYIKGMRNEIMEGNLEEEKQVKRNQHAQAEKEEKLRRLVGLRDMEKVALESLESRL